MLSASDILKVDNLTKYFGGLAAVSNCSLKIKKGSITGIIGPNGSGKSTLFNLIAGNLKSSDGSVEFNNEDITDVPSYELFSKGLLRTFQIAHEFSNMSVIENLMMVPGNQSGENLLNVLNEVFVKENNVKVVLATHSPSTIALAEESNIYVVNRDGQNRIEKQNRQEALKILSEGFITLDEGLQIFDQFSKKELTLFTEGNNISFIKKIYNIIH